MAFHPEAVIYSWVEKMIPQIKVDHENARLLSEGISEVRELSINIKQIKTNIIYFELNSSNITGTQLVESMSKRGVKFFETSKNRFRMVTHYGITKEDILETLSIFNQILKTLVYKPF